MDVGWSDPNLSLKPWLSIDELEYRVLERTRLIPTIIDQLRETQFCYLRYSAFVKKSKALRSAVCTLLGLEKYSASSLFHDIKLKGLTPPKREEIQE